jgi:hypothetical protein
MAQKKIDTTGNEHHDLTMSKVQDNFNDIYAGNVSTGPTGTGGPTGPTGTTASGHSGTFTANGASSVSVTDANVTANSLIIITLKTVGGTVGAVPAIKTITASTGFTVAATASDTSVYNYGIIG